MRYFWEQCPNEVYNELHLSIKLPHVSMLDTEYGFSTSSIDKLDVEDRDFVKTLLEVDGVEAIGFMNYKCTIKKGEVFEWKSIRIGIIEVFQRRYVPHGKMVEIKPLKMPLPQHRSSHDLGSCYDDMDY